MNCRFLALTLVLLVLGCEAQEVAPEAEEANPTLLTQVQESLFKYLYTAKDAAAGLYNKASLTGVDEKIRDMYSQSTAAVTTYAGIFTDQLFFLLSGDQ
ncbi:apolipoprotein C-II [Suncus etruscus]|uniref:apolipoprotein C-II n=1 Tax=Suncus etruscus TaxID=109475 RepID=UPI00210F51B0|nr:apolipoprotein C-II [Suncus etruscus]